MRFCLSHHPVGASPLPLDVGYFFFFGGTQYSPVDGCSATSFNFGVLAGEERTSFYSTILLIHLTDRVAVWSSNLIPENHGLDLGQSFMHRAKRESQFLSKSFPGGLNLKVSWQTGQMARLGSPLVSTGSTCQLGSLAEECSMMHRASSGATAWRSRCPRAFQRPRGQHFWRQQAAPRWGPWSSGAAGADPTSCLLTKGTEKLKL